jgi:hypothetical protein
MQNILPTPIPSFDYSIKWDVDRLAYYLGELPTQKLQNRGYHLLPYLPPHAPGNIIYLPNLPYLTILPSIKKIQQQPTHTPMVLTAKIYNDLRKIVTPTWSPKMLQEKTNEMQTQWNTINRVFWRLLTTIYPQFTNIPIQIKIHVSTYGTPISFNLFSPEKPIVYLFPRVDQNMGTIVEGLLTAILRPKLQNIDHRSWEQIEAIIDHLLTDSAFARLYPQPIKPTLWSLESDLQHSDWITDSQNFESKLGIYQESPWAKKQDKHYYGAIEIQNLSHKEEILLEVLLTKRSQTVRNEELADVLWPNDENWSLWRVAKSISRLRSKIKASGINLPVIHARRKYGYTIS